MVTLFAYNNKSGFISFCILGLLNNCSMMDKLWIEKNMIKKYMGPMNPISLNPLVNGAPHDSYTLGLDHFKCKSTFRYIKLWLTGFLPLPTNKRLEKDKTNHLNWTVVYTLPKLKSTKNISDKGERILDLTDYWFIFHFFK